MLMQGCHRSLLSGLVLSDTDTIRVPKGVMADDAAQSHTRMSSSNPLYT